MVDLSTSAGLLTFLQSNGYFIIFLIMFLEGPVITFAAAFLASLGVFNIYVIFLLSILGNLIPDTILFLIGKHSRINTIKKISEFFGLNKPIMEKIENVFSKHTTKLIIFFKLIPGFAIPGLALAGFSKVSFKKFFIISLTLNLLSAILFTVLGFYSGITVSSLLKYLKLEKYILVAFGIFIIIIFILIKIFKKYYNQRLTRSM
ncbi:MAG: VTT domain-containing protein [Nanoarchaeota archaeon]